MKVQKSYQRLAYLAAAVSLICVILAGIGRLIMRNLVITTGSYMSLATVAILFAIYFLIQGAITANKG